ncbi:MAG: hypothetical protein E8D47_06020 [Nitrospira sp.]|nr:MAG: hypothetical protein E8D47_06020 [Nitrospira sp.]
MPVVPIPWTDLNSFPPVIQPKPTLNLSRDTSRLYLSLTIDQSRQDIELKLASLPVVLEDFNDQCEGQHAGFPRRVVHAPRRYWLRSNTCGTAINQATVTAIQAKLTSLVAWIGPIYAYPNTSDRAGLVGVEPDVLIIQIKQNVPDAMFQQLTRYIALEGFTRVPGMEKDFKGFHFFKNTSSNRNSSFEVRKRLMASSSWQDMIEAVRFSYLPMLSSSGMVPLDSRYMNQWNMWRIKAGEDPAVCSTSSGPQGSGWDLSTGSGSVVIWMLDAGCCDERHPDLQGRLVPNEGKDYRAYPAITNDISTLGAARPRSDHTTAVAGVLAASITPPPILSPCQPSSGQGLAGVAGSCTVYPLAIEETATDYQVGAAINLAATNATLSNGDKARVLCITIGRQWIWTGTRWEPSGWPGYATYIEPKLTDALNNGLVICVLTHNDSESSICYPATSPSVIACGATDQSNLRASFSNYGPEVSVVAPAQSILVLNWCQGIPNCGGNDGYHWLSGTSFAAPQVAGLAALLLSRFPCLTTQEVRQIIESSATPLSYHSEPGATTKNGKKWHEQVGYGLINVKAALEAPPIFKCVSRPKNRDETPPNPPTGLRIY